MAERTSETPPRSSAKRFKSGYETHQSVFTFRYGSPEMRRVWSQEVFWGNVRSVWIAVAKTQHEAGIVTTLQLNDLERNKDMLSVERIFQLEKYTEHDIAAAIAEYSEVAKKGGAVLHQGLTSEDALSNAEMLQTRDAFGIIRPKILKTLGAFGEKIAQTKDIVTTGMTHLQAAEPTTVGYRLTVHAQELLDSLNFMDCTYPLVKAKGIKGAVGTSASIQELLKNTGMSAREHETRVMKKLGLENYALAAGQTPPRSNLFYEASMLAAVGLALHHFAFDFQLLQSSAIDEISEPRRKGAVGSSAMPHKRNPIQSENIDSLTELLPGTLVTSWITGSFAQLERTLRDSAGRRVWMPEAFMIVDEALTRTEKIVKGMNIHKNAIRRNLLRFTPFCATEILLTRLGQAGMNRQDAHEILRDLAEQAVEKIRDGEPNPMIDLVSQDPKIASLLDAKTVAKSFDDVIHHVGDAPERCVEFLENSLYPVLKAG